MHYPEHWTTWGGFILSREIIGRPLNSTKYLSNHFMILIYIYALVGRRNCHWLRLMKRVRGYSMR